MARNWSQEGIELGRRLAAELEQEGIRLPMELTAMLDDADADGGAHRRDGSGGGPPAAG